MARSTFYYYCSLFKQKDKYQSLKKKIQQLYHQNKGRYGYRRVYFSLRNMGLLINHKTVYRLMQNLQLKTLIRGKKYKSYRGQEGRKVSNQLNRDFVATAPHQKWATDVTEFKVRDQKLYLSPIIDLYNQEIVSYQMSEKPSFELVVKMVKKALPKLKQKEGVLLHSDQGWHYQMLQYQNLLKQNHISQSMSRKGNCLDNAVIENYFGILKTELYYLKKYQSIEELKIDIQKYIEYYNKKRIKLNLNGMSPVQYRAHH